MIWTMAVWAIFCLGFASILESSPEKSVARFIAETIFTACLFWSVGVALVYWIWWLVLKVAGAS